MSRFRVAAFALLLILVAVPLVSVGSEIEPAEVCQPFDLYDGIMISRVTYLAYGWDPAEPVLRTCAADTVRNPMTNRLRQFNAAFAAKLQVRATWSTLDTLKVELNTSRMHRFVTATGSRDSMEVVRATIECIKANAGGRGSMFKFLQLDVTGHRAFRELSGVFSLAEYRCGPMQRDGFYSPRIKR